MMHVVGQCRVAYHKNDIQEKPGYEIIHKVFKNNNTQKGRIKSRLSAPSSSLYYFSNK